MSFYNYLSFSGKPVVLLPEYKRKLASGEILRSSTTSKDVVTGLLTAIDASNRGSGSAVKPIHFDRSSVRVKTIEDLFYSTTLNKRDPVTGIEFPFVYRQKILTTNSYHDYRYAIETFLSSAKKLKLVNPYSDLVEGYQTSISKETIFHYCFYYDLVSKVPLAILERYPEIVHYWMVMLHHFTAAGRTREAELAKESILYLVTSSKVFREAKDNAGNLALYYCSDLEIAAKYIDLYPESIDNINKCGVNILLSSYTTRDIRLLVINCSPSIVYQSVNDTTEDVSLDVKNKEYLWYSINDPFIIRFIIDMFPMDLLLATNGKSTIFNTSKCFNSLLYLVNKIPKETLVEYIRNNPKCYEVLFSIKIKVIRLYRESNGSGLEAKMEYIRLDGHQNDQSYLDLKAKFDDIINDDIYA